VLFLTPGVIVFAAFAGAVLSCAGATGKVLVPGSGSDDLLTTDEPAAAGPAQPEEEEEEEESQVHSHLCQKISISPRFTFRMSNKPTNSPRRQGHCAANAFCILLPVVLR
jgi:hypothetical protein